jgi:hypothetical protein
MRNILFVFLYASLALPACAQQSSPKTTPLKTVAMEPQAVEKLLEKRLTLNFVPGEVVVKMKPAAALRVMPSATDEALRPMRCGVRWLDGSAPLLLARVPRRDAHGAAAGSAPEGPSDCTTGVRRRHASVHLLRRGDAPLPRFGPHQRRWPRAAPRDRRRRLLQLAASPHLPGWDSDPELVNARLVIAEIRRPLTSNLRRDPRFKVVYEDKTAAVFVSTAGDPGNK